MQAPPQDQPQDPPPTLAALAAFDGSLSQRVYQTLRQSILSLGYRPGQMIRKGEICAALGVSRSPVGEAMARLATEGLVDVVPQAGSFVARVSMAEIREGAFLREALELAAVEQVATTLTPAQLAELTAILQQQADLTRAGDAEGFYAADGALHEAIMAMTGHRRLAAMTRTAWVHVDRARRLILPRPGRIAETLGEHQAIVAALAAHDPQTARAATRAHLRQLLTQLEPLAEQRPELFT